MRYFLFGILFIACLAIHFFMFSAPKKAESEQVFFKKTSLEKSDQKIVFDSQLESLRESRLQLAKQIEAKKILSEQKKAQKRKDKELAEMIAKTLDLQNKVFEKENQTEAKYIEFLKQTNGKVSFPNNNDRKMRKNKRSKSKKLNQT